MVHRMYGGCDSIVVHKVTTKLADRRSKDRRQKQEPPVTARWILTNVFALIRRFGSRVSILAGLAYGVHEARIAITAFADKTSAASLMIEVAGHLNVTIAVSVAIAGLSTGLWANEYRRHRNTRERLTNRITALELRIDPKRTSSSLTSQGMTSPGDL